MFGDGLLDLVNSAFRACVKVFLDKHHIRQGLGIFYKLLHFQITGYVGATIANKHANTDVGFGLIFQNKSPLNGQR